MPSHSNELAPNPQTAQGRVFSEHTLWKLEWSQGKVEVHPTPKVMRLPVGMLGILGSNKMSEVRYRNTPYPLFLSPSHANILNPGRLPPHTALYTWHGDLSYPRAAVALYSTPFPHVPHPDSASSLRQTSSLGAYACLNATRVCPSQNSKSESEHVGLPSKGGSITEHRGENPWSPSSSL